jgi:hypothetical protein
MSRIEVGLAEAKGPIGGDDRQILGIVERANLRTSPGPGRLQGSQLHRRRQPTTSVRSQDSCHLDERHRRPHSRLAWSRVVTCPVSGPLMLA